MKRTGFLISLLIIIASCQFSSKREYKFDKIIIAKAHCHIIDEKSDYGFGDCPEYAISIDNNLNYFTTKSIKSSSELECFSGKFSISRWDSFYDDFADKMLKDSNNYNFKVYIEKMKKGDIVDMSNGPFYYIWLYKNNKNIKTIFLYDLNNYKSLFDNLIKTQIMTVKIRDTILIDLKKFMWMPPPKAREPQVHYIKQS